MTTETVDNSPADGDTPWRRREQIGDATLYLGDCVEVMAALPAESVDSVVADPEYGLGFMGHKWDARPPGVEKFAECLRVLKPGGHLLAFGGARTYHRMAVAVEDAGFEIRDQIMWLYGSGFPKSQDVSKAIDKAAGVARKSDYQPNYKNMTHGTGMGGGQTTHDDLPATEAARQWDGWGTALKPAHEPIIVARKPLAGTVAANVQQHGTGALNIDACRIDTAIGATYQSGGDGRVGSGGIYQGGYRGEWNNAEPHPESARHHAKGRWPADVIHDGSDEVVVLFPASVSRPVKPENAGESGDGTKRGLFANISAISSAYYDTETSAARFFYCAKASREDRNEGCEALAERPLHWSSGSESPGTFQGEGTNKAARNNHPTVKPTDLMRYLCRLVTPPGGVVLDPFMGSGSTGKAACLEGFQFIGIELEPEYFDIATARIRPATQQRRLFP